MMRRAALLLLALAAVPAFASWHPVFNTNEVSIAVGETDSSVVVHFLWTGFSQLHPIDWTFRSSDERIAVFNGHVTRNDTPLRITGSSSGQYTVILTYGSPR